jgi:hypothetical protein
MNSGMRLHLEAHSSEAGDVPVKVEIFNESFQAVEQKWLTARDTSEFALDPGVYGVRASLSSGKVFEQAVYIQPDRMEDCRVPLYAASPHESQEWAYFTQPAARTTSERLWEPRYAGLWLRLWEYTPAAGWTLASLPAVDVVTWDGDGVSYSLSMPGQVLRALQVGGDKIPWKLVAVPPSERVQVLVRPAPRSTRGHPLKVVVSGGNVESETLLALIQRGDTNQARDWDQQARIAENLLYSKVRDPLAAAVGGYFLIRLNDMARLHDWANNLANLFDWMADGAVIHAWQLLAEGRGGRQESQSAACARLLTATQRGFPLYTEGLRLLRDGLLLFARQPGRKDKKVHEALNSIGEYAAAADWSVTTTTFLGGRPDNPSSRPRKGQPRQHGPRIFVYDVPLREAIRQGVLRSGERLSCSYNARKRQCKLNASGRLELADGRSFNSLGALHAALADGGEPSDPWWNWQVTRTGEALAEAVKSLRVPPTP